MAALQPNTKCCGASLVRVVVRLFKDWVVQGSSSTPATVCFRSAAQRTVRNTFWSIVVSVSSSIVLFCVGEQREKFLTRLNVSHSCVVRCQGTSFGGVVAAAVLVARFFQRFRFAFPTWFKRSLRASRDRSGVKGGASNFLLRTRRCGGFQLRTWWESPSHLHCSSTAVLNVQNSIACKILHAQKLEPTMAKGELSDFSKQLTRCCSGDGLKSCSRSPTVHCAGRPIDGPSTLCFALQSCGCHGLLPLSSDGISNDGTLLMPCARQHHWTCLFASELQSG